MLIDAQMLSNDTENETDQGIDVDRGNITDRRNCIEVELTKDTTKVKFRTR